MLSNIVGITKKKLIVERFGLRIMLMVMRSILRRSKISEIAPDGKAKRKIGRVLAVVIRETNKGFGASEVISHEAPTSYIAAPTYEKSAAVHNALYKLSLNGFRPDAEIFSSSCPLFPLSTIENK